MMGMKKNTFQRELKNTFTAVEERDDIDSLNKNMTEMIQQSVISIAKQTEKQKNPKLSIAYNSTNGEAQRNYRGHIEYVEICKTITKESEERHAEAQLR